jgi:uncharacterized protein YkwD
VDLVLTSLGNNETTKEEIFIKSIRFSTATLIIIAVLTAAIISGCSNGLDSTEASYAIQANNIDNGITEDTASEKSNTYAKNDYNSTGGITEKVSGTTITDRTIVETSKTTTRSNTTTTTKRLTTTTKRPTTTTTTRMATTAQQTKTTRAITTQTTRMATTETQTMIPTTKLMTTQTTSKAPSLDDYYLDIRSDSLSQDEKQLAQLVNDYRKSLGLQELKISKSLTIVARTHVYDSNKYQPENGIDSRGIKGNLHSWSANGDWTAVVYTSDHEYASLMWSKPSELTQYKSNGYEISAGGVTITPTTAFYTWKGSPGHNAVMTGQGSWSSLTVMGVAIKQNYAHIWFGKESDPAGYYDITI